ncbi:MAG: UMP kinase [candidate division WOR-3 bacterium]|nr:UMP kinase [candidate division WOR-3 bacterium]MCX7757697.1 UMP kinase [candidate division WOR-3 bacterium]MDW7987433.1 UMP kinase [candidate division WOR-3 bacterium]
MKLTGEIFSDWQRLKEITKEITYVYKCRKKLAIVLGGGNFFRGRNQSELTRLTVDYAGMLGTVINGVILHDLLKEKAVHLSALEIKGLVQIYQIEEALSYWRDNKILILSGGTGHPYFSTDTATVLRALELNAELILKATNVNGVYTSDPRADKRAQILPKISYEEALKLRLKILDETALVLLKEHKIPVVVFNVFKAENLTKILNGEKIGSIIC